MEHDEELEYIANEQDQLANWADNQNKEPFNKKITLSDNWITIQIENEEVFENERYQRERKNYFRDLA